MSPNTRNGPVYAHVIASRLQQIEEQQEDMQRKVSLQGVWHRRDVDGLAYIHISGRGDGGAEQAATNVDPGVLAALALEQLEALIARFNDADMPYEVKRRANSAFAPGYRFDAYAHLARVAEWLTEGDQT